MKLLKIAGGLVLLLLLVVFIGGLFLSPKFHIERSVLVNAAPARPYALVADARRWKEWSVWNQRDPAMKIDYFGAASGAGAGWAWTSTSEGDGRMTFTTAEPNRRLAYDLYFPDFGTTSQGAFTFTPEGGGTRVTWTMEGDMGRNPALRWMALFMGDMAGKDFDAGLARLKALAEAP